MGEVKMSTAIHVQTESGDHYNFCSELDLSADEVKVKVKGHLMEEYEYISDWWVNLSDGSDVNVDFSED
jgi:hypothetical protein